MAFPVKIVKVYQSNLSEQFGIIRSLLPTYPIISIDTEFPGTVFQTKKPHNMLSPEENYVMMRENVNHLKLIQLGFTMCDKYGNLPLCRFEDGGELLDSYRVWEFNFREFDPDRDIQNLDSINLLKKEGIDFSKNQNEGIYAQEFAKEFMSSGLGFSFRSFLGCPMVNEVDPNLTWVFFHSTYDVGYLIKVLTQKPVPANHVTFMGLVRIYLGNSVFDLKELIRAEPCGWNCGLNKVAENLNVKRSAGKSHQAGSDSLLTMQCFMAFVKLTLGSSGKDKTAFNWQMFKRKLHGLEIDQLKVREELKMMRKSCQVVMYHPCRGRSLFVRVPIRPINTYSYRVPVVRILRFSQLV